MVSTQTIADPFRKSAGPSGSKSGISSYLSLSKALMPGKGPDHPDAPEIILLALRPLASDRPVSVRLRWILKQLLRQQQFRCIRITGSSVDSYTGTMAGRPEAIRQGRDTFISGQADAGNMPYRASKRHNTKCEEIT
jgi:hypothetical protein